MKYILSLCVVLLLSTTIFAQHTLKLIIKSSEVKEALVGATVTIKLLNKTSFSDTAGIATFTNIAAGSYTVFISFVGFDKTQVAVKLPMETTEPLEVLMDKGEDPETEVVVTAMRLSRTIANTPTRTEIISGEELAEKANMKPGDIRMMLSETTGIQVQQTSATSFNAGIRIQGLDGRYTQILRDGYPLYSGFSGSLSILQVAPLDLRQVEVIKGSASTLYGGGAIAGLVNLVSKTPEKDKDLNFLANGTSAGGLDLSGFYSQRNGKVGLTVYAARNTNTPFDPANIGLTAIPKFKRYTINPRLFLYGKNTKADIGVSYITEDRTGGSLNYIKNGGNGFFEKNITDRISTQLGIAHRIGKHSTIQFKNSYSHFNRIIEIPGYAFSALQQSSFSEFTWNKNGEKADWVIGANFLTDDLNERNQTFDPERDYHNKTFGLFAQNVWTVTEKIVLESGIRSDYVSDYGFEWLPRVSAMFRLNPKLTTRIGGGFGYKTPTIFTEEAERIQFQHLLPIDVNKSKNERSVGGNWDINYRTKIGDVGFGFNHLFFYTRLNRPLVLVNAPGRKISFQNSTGHIDTKGMETNLKITYKDFKLFIGYTFTDAETHIANAKQWQPLTAKHRLNNMLMYEVEDQWKIGLEAYYFSKQPLSDGTFGKPYWITGFMVEKIWKKISLYINFENFTDTRQSKFDTIFTGTTDNPKFRDIYAPVEGFVVNGGIKIRL